ncbi:SCO6745 family protein [Pseudonocardia sp. GCM10023141]|uniref:SCO6745 family protein n=1 Tax=Pseudonocardia sp. GCM10023141 TaxID=3252653 RepID=UPI00361038CA
MSAVQEHRARRMWRAVEPVHAVTYFAPEPKAACEELGTKGYWMSYFAQRAAPLGAAPPELITALFYNFSLGLVARAVPDVWALAGPEQYLEVRLRAMDAALHRLAGAELLTSAGVAEAAEIAREAATAAPTSGRALGAANAALDWPEAPHLQLWHAQTILRELRGDGHVAALLLAGLDPVETLVVFAADNGMDGTWLRERRGWSEPEWEAAVSRLTERGLVEDRQLTAAGVALRAEVEAHTDALADAPWLAIGADRAERLVELVAPLVRAIIAGDGVNTVNPMGMRPLVAATP